MAHGKPFSPILFPSLLPLPLSSLLFLSLSLFLSLPPSFPLYLSLAIALIGKPPVVFLDEPSTGLDPETKRNIWALIDKFKQGRCVVLTTHSMDEADALCGRIGTLHRLMNEIGLFQIYFRWGCGSSPFVINIKTVSSASQCSTAQWSQLHAHRAIGVYPFERLFYFC